MALALYDKLAAQDGAEDVEILLLLDNKQRSIGAKREMLVQLSQGKYVVFVDDDDEVAHDYIPQILAVADEGAHVIVFDTICSVNADPPVTVRHSLEFENEQYNPSGFRRKPWHVHPWRSELAKAAHFPDRSYGEDWGWVEQMIAHAKTEASAGGGALFHYRYRSNVTEAVA